MSDTPRFSHRYRRPVPHPSSRSQVRQKISRIRDFYHLEAALDDLHNAFMSEELCSLEEEL